jgi:hypothetical protein
MFELIIEFGLISDLPSWTIRTVDFNMYVELKGQYPPQDTSYGYKATYTSIALLSKSDPITIFINRTDDDLTFKGIFWSEYNFILVDDITLKLEALKLLITPIDELGRPPVVTFTYGDDLSYTGVVTAISNIKHELYEDGVLKGVSFDMTIKKQGYYQIETTVPGVAFQKETRYVVPKWDDTFEMIAYNVYKDPMYGVKLRQINYEYLFAGDADKIKVLELEHPTMQGEVKPYSLQMKDEPTFWTRMMEILADRSTLTRRMR